ncbi:3-oxoacyl-[acyl-carrier-protein] reductase [Wolbachia endosymbiont of Folsomia candida]|uniref:3-oxoacyl-[acyl-carrier-protein] reductase n=1 Tax=Wolbachia endosymbiont of Folsomia candida TaxID=169402 RepID=UPI000B5E1560|nr:3-oxoacyl-[acyl-carrier-protein] reductase [Wolbachia endosymbiont of Folsomia candida]APR98063.1 3-oxoacyl-[acyl-carrier-protein] reductase [Wolbachia endosymbiont of Folsomia candida]
MFRLDNRKFLVTGASGGIGQAIVKIMHEAGAILCISGTKKEVLEEVAKKYEKNIHVLPCDLSNSEEVSQLITKASELMEGFDGLICNAGITQDSLILRMTNDSWQKVIDINLTSTFTLNREAFKKLIKNDCGRIINISSIVGLTGNAGQANYAASKAGVIAMSKSIAKEVASRGITVNCVAPGFIDTKMTEVLNTEQKEKILDNIPMKRMGTGEEIAAGVLFLASDEARYITGCVLNINGGLFM